MIKITYYENYKQLNTIDAIKREVKQDVMYAMVWNPDRIEPIRKAAEKAMNELDPDWKGDEEEGATCGTCMHYGGDCINPMSDFCGQHMRIDDVCSEWEGMGK